MPATRSKSKAATDAKAKEDAKVLEEKSIRLYGQTEFNWLAFHAPHINSATWTSAEALFYDSFAPIAGIVKAGKGTLDAPHVSVVYGTDVKWFDGIKAMALGIKLTTDDIKFVDVPYLIKPKYPFSEGAYAICQDVICPKITQLKRAIEEKYNFKNKQESEEKREIPLHITLFVINGQPKDGVKVRVQ